LVPSFCFHGRHQHTALNALHTVVDAGPLQRRLAESLATSSHQDLEAVSTGRARLRVYEDPLFVLSFYLPQGWTEQSQNLSTVHSDSQRCEPIERYANSNSMTSVQQTDHDSATNHHQSA
jgi:hypothetical protein